MENDLTDDADINREAKRLYTCTNTLMRRFKRCLVRIKTQLFKTYGLCLFNTALWLNFKVKAI